MQYLKALFSWINKKCWLTCKVVVLTLSQSCSLRQSISYCYILSEEKLHLFICETVCWNKLLMLHKMVFMLSSANIYVTTTNGSSTTTGIRSVDVNWTKFLWCWKYINLIFLHQILNVECHQVYLHGILLQCY